MKTHEPESVEQDWTCAYLIDSSNPPLAPTDAEAPRKKAEFHAIEVKRPTALGAINAESAGARKLSPREALSGVLSCPALDRYRDALCSLPASGGGGCHVALLRVANLGRMAGVSREQTAQDIAGHVHGTRRVPPSEIAAAVAKAFNSAPPPVIARPTVDGKKLLKFVMDRGADFTEADLWNVSPVRIDWPPARDAVEVLRRLYEPEERLFIGSRHDAGPECIRPASEWIARFESGAAVPEHVIPNPLSGGLGKTKDGKPSYRADNCVERFKIVVIEFDTMPRAQQIQFFAGSNLPLLALIDSGGKSLHGWAWMDVNDAPEWERRVEGLLFSMLTPVGVDSSCKNEARLSRMPGHWRAEKNNWQRILYLSPSADAVIR